MCVCVRVCVCVCACTVFSSRVFCPFYQCEHPLSTCVHSIDNNIFSAFEYAYICVFLVSCAGSLCLCAFLCVKSSQVTFIYIALLTIQIVSKQLHNIKMGK